ncbi:MAG: hypothetical protein H7Z19_00405, partial [Chitinophagaceae bacterium]|nr:hypothetical protein [Rubrivivax sp.]
MRAPALSLLASLALAAAATSAAPVLTIEADARLALVNGPHVAAEITRDRYF